MKFVVPNRVLALAAFALLAPAVARASQSSTDRCAFVGFKSFNDFATDSTSADEKVLVSPEISTPIAWDELIASWNVPPGVDLKIEARVIFPDHTTKYYTLGSWSDNPANFPRTSIKGQRDEDGAVQTDTLVMRRHGGKVQVRLSLKGSNDKQPALKYLGLSFCNSSVKAAPREPNRAAWGKLIEVPERRQGDYPDEKGWCSPTSLSMVMTYWGTTLQRPELTHNVPDIAAAIYDSAMDGTGNWPFNTAYAGSFPGMRAYVTRLDDISELEDWIAAGITPILSVSSYLTRDRHSGPDNGHLIVCVGFTDQGDMIANDPGVSVKHNERPRRVYPRQRVIDAWKKSKNTVYLIYPDTAAIPPNVSGHWDNGK